MLNTTVGIFRTFLSIVVNKRLRKKSTSTGLAWCDVEPAMPLVHEHEHRWVLNIFIFVVTRK